MHWLVYCRVVDNFGDIGFAWRLCADLARRGETARLVVDDASALAWMAPGGCAGVTVEAWTDAGVDAADVAVETFGCGFPDSIGSVRTATGTLPVLINIEHLSAERFVERSHGLASPAAAGGAHRQPVWFYFPGFTERTGGLLRESSLPHPQSQSDATERLHVTAFCYRNDAFASLLDALSSRPTTVTCAPGAATEHALAWRAGGESALEIVAAPFCSQTEYDALLRASDLNLVRGEDSLVRAIWAGKPFLWQLYPQSDGAHVAKLEAFLDVFLEHADPGLAAGVRSASRSWNSIGSPRFDLPDLDAWRSHCVHFSKHLHAYPDMGSQLIGFARSRR